MSVVFLYVNLNVEKIVSSIEKIEENLITGTQLLKVDAHNQWGN